MTPLQKNNPLWRKPQHHQDLPHAHDHVHWMELFYDLIHVVMIFLLGNYLSHHHDMAGFITFVVLFLSMWLSWGEFSAYNSLYVSTDWLYRISGALLAVSVMFMAASISSIEPSLSNPGKGFAYFAAAYAFNRFILAVMYFRVVKVSGEKTTLGKEQALRFTILGAWFLLAALIPGHIGSYMFLIGIVLMQLYYFIPKITVMRLPSFKPRIGHFAERFLLLLLIVNGEGFFKLIVTLSEKGIYKVGPMVMFNVAVGGMAVFVLTWTYYDTVGNSKIREGVRYLYMSWVGHMLLMLAAVMVGIALAGEVYVGFNETFPLFYGYLGCFGLALYWLCILLLQQSVERHQAHRFITPWVMLLAIAIALICSVVFPRVPAIIGNLVWILSVITPLAIGITTGYLTLSKEMNAENAEEASQS